MLKRKNVWVLGGAVAAPGMHLGIDVGALFQQELDHRLNVLEGGAMQRIVFLATDILRNRGG
jgi:hypothetical protein